MYEGGRQGQKRLAADYGPDEDDDDERGSIRRREKQARDQLASVIKKQFRLRKGESESTGEEPEDRRKAKEEERILSYAKVKAAEFTANKISGLDVKTREDYLGKRLAKFAYLIVEV